MAYPSEWNAYPGNITNAADVMNGDPPNFRARTTYDSPADHPDDAAPGVLAVHKRAMDKHHAYTMANSTLNVALLASIGPDNKVLLLAVYNVIPMYALAPFQIVDAMFQEHGVLAGADLGRLRAPLQEPLSALADLERHMNKEQIHVGLQKIDASRPRQATVRIFRGILGDGPGFSRCSRLNVYLLCCAAHC